jgi:hypothetical protein
LVRFTAPPIKRVIPPFFGGVTGLEVERRKPMGEALRNINIKTLIGETPLSGIEYGFFSRIAQIAYCGAMN